MDTTMNPTEDLLIELGINRTEAKVYYALLSLGSAPASKVALKAGIHRVNVYDALAQLEEKGLVATVTKGEKSYYEPASPEALQKLLIAKRKKLDSIHDMLPQLQSLYEQEKTKQAVHHFMGKKGLITIYNHILETVSEGGEFVSFGSTGVMREHFPEYTAQFVRRLKEKKIKPRITYYHTAKKVKPFENMHVRYLPEQIESMPMTFYLYEGWVAIINFHPMLGIEIQSQEIYNSFMKYAEWLWGISKE